jgi:hypothetical protein
MVWGADGKKMEHELQAEIQAAIQSFNDRDNRRHVVTCRIPEKLVFDTRAVDEIIVATKMQICDLIANAIFARIEPIIGEVLATAFKLDKTNEG